MRPHLHQPNPNQDTSRERIQRTNSNQRLGVVAVEDVQNTDADSHADGRHQRKARRQEELLGQRYRGRLAAVDGRADGGVVGVHVGVVGVGKGDAAVAERCDTCAQRDAFEELVEDDDDGEGDEEGVAGDNEGDTDN